MQKFTRISSILALSATSFFTRVDHAAAASAQQLLVDRATLTVQSLFVDSASDSRAKRYLNRSRAVMICPSLFRMSIVFGGAGGGCLLLARDAQGSWSDPAFYTLSTGSVGLQFGIESSQMIFFIMSDRGLQALLDSQFKFEAGASASFANIGSGIQSGTAGESDTDILALQKSSGLYAGASLGGSKLTSNSSANRAYYGKLVGPESIVINMRVNNTGADPLRRILMQYSRQVPAGSANPVAGNNPVSLDDSAAKPYQDHSRNAIKTQNLPAH